MNTTWDDKPIYLSPCPFCGGNASLKHIGNDHTKKRTIEIKCGGKCRATMVNSALLRDFAWLENVSVSAWNQRVSATAQEGE